MQNETLAAVAKNFAVKHLPDSEAEIVGDIPFETIAPYKEHALKHLAEHMDLPGFRKGHVPPEMVLKKVGEVHVLEEAVELFMQDFYATLLEVTKVSAVGRPDIRITKLAPGNPVSLTIHVSVFPTLTLPKNWHRVGEGVPTEPATLATDEEVEQTLKSLQESRAVREEGKEPVVQELTDEFAKSIGKFENLEELKTQIKKGIGEEKERAAKDKRRGRIIDALLEGVEVEIPKIFVESELDKIIAQLKEDVARFNVPFEDYLKRVEKTEEGLREEYRDQARKRAKLQLTLNKIAEEEKIEAEKEAVETEMKHALEHFPKANPELLRIHIETVLKNEKVLQMLEGSEQK